MEKFNGLEIVNKKVILGYTVYMVELDKRNIGKDKLPFYGLDNGMGFYWAIALPTGATYFGPFRKTAAAFANAVFFLEKKEVEL